MDYKTIVLSREEGVAVLRMNRPNSLNALDPELGGEVGQALEFCRRTREVRAIILTGTDKAFCSGGDIAYFRKFPDGDPSAPFRKLIPIFHAAIGAIRRIPKPVIAAINGAAGGGGMTLAAACDLRICTASARFRQGYTGIGLTGDGAWSLLMPLLVGFGKAMELTFLNPVFDARQALQWGFVNMVVEDAELAEKSMETARMLAQGPSRAFAIAKENLNHAVLGGFDAVLERERAGMIEGSSTADYREGISAFFDRRTPVFSGK
jgi:2-(1,2-epoxy-1,2-dihydrophenyl)acetyl-CoA isomerase